MLRIYCLQQWYCLSDPGAEEALYDIVDVLVEVAEARGASPAQVALAWLLGRGEVTSVTIGARSSHQLSDNLGAVQLVLSAAQRERLDRASRTTIPYPYWMQQFHDKDRVIGAVA